MAVSKIVSNQEFKQMVSYHPYAENESQKQSMKKTLLARVREAYEDKYYRLKQGTKDAIDMMCWFASERGFVFAGDDYLGDRHDVSDRTIRNVAQKLRKKGLILTVYRRSTKHNGRGCPIHLFVDHPYFDYWTSLLRIEFQADFQAEKNETPCETKEEPKKNISTYDLTLKTFNKHNKRKEDHFLDSDFVPSYVPERFILAVQPFFG
ncbi:transcriptional regulator, partial [Bacillus songklensis]